jgi:diguanylate cyclase (GGDEF)-like protein/PAS domain S-box-containing protein
MEMMHHSYQLEIVILSIFIAIFGAYTSVDLANRITLTMNKRLLWITGSSFVMGISTWSMHFTGMLALSSFRSNYFFNIELTILSLLISIIGYTAAFLIFFKHSPSDWQIILSGCLFGLGIVGMHFTGMEAMMGDSIRYNRLFVALSAFFAVSLSILSMYIWNHYRQNSIKSIGNTLGISIMIGIAISLMHYTAMVGMTFFHVPEEHSSSVINRKSLSIFVTIINFILFGTTLLVSYVKRAKAEQKAYHKEVKYRSLFEQNQDGIIILDKFGTIVDINQATEGMTGYAMEELNGGHFEYYIHPEDLLVTRSYFQDSLAGVHHEFQVRIFSKNNSEIILKVKNVPLQIEGKVDGVYAIIRDITEQVRVEKQLREQDEKYELITENMKDLVSIVYPSGEFDFVSPSHKNVLGYKISDLIGSQAFDLVHPDDYERLINDFKKILKTKETVMAVYRLQHKNGYYIAMESKGSPILDQENNIKRILISSRDVSERIEKEKALALSEQQYGLIAENSSDLIRVVGVDGINQYASPSHYTLLGYSSDEIIGTRFDSLIHPDDKERINEMYQSNLSSAKKVVVEYQFQHKNGSRVWLEAHSTPVHNELGHLSHFVVVSREISERKHYEEQLKQLAFYDSLTGIPNRRLFQDRLLQTIQKAKRDQTNLALFYLDCDRFKWVNDTYGHETGDLLLKGFVERVEGCIRESDTIARLGGDEFAIIVDGFESIQDVARIANRIIQKVRNPWNLNGAEFSISTSIGIAVYPEDGTDMDTLLAHADKALYESKESGRDTYHFYTKEIAAKIDRNILLEDGLKLAISHGHFHLVYQPQMDIQENKLAGLEVLLRYTHPKIGMVSPVEFIPMCEKIGIIDEVTEWVMSGAFKQQKEWKESGYGEIPMAINISPTTLENKSFLQTVQYYLEKFETNPATIEFELTEDAFMHNMKYVVEILESLNRMGIKISLDDFGAGYSSLKYLKDLPINKVKIDRSFIMGIPEKEKEKAIIESILDLTSRLQGEVICEGVETEEQLTFLQVKGCRLVQGFYFSKPLPKEELETTILKRQIPSFPTKTVVVNHSEVSSFYFRN